MKRILCVFIIVIMLFTSASWMVMAAIDAVDLSYKLNIEVTDKDGNASNTFQIGDTIHVRLSLIYTGTGRHLYMDCKENFILILMSSEVSPSEKKTAYV